MELPKNETTFNINVVGDATLKKYEGEFTVRCVLTVGQKLLMESEKSRLIGSSSFPTNDLVGLSEILATLKAKIIEAPEWWKQSLGGTSLSDENVLIELYTKVLEAETQWKQKIKDLANPPATEGSSSPKP
jgi:hypothetical protein